MLRGFPEGVWTRQVNVTETAEGFIRATHRSHCCPCPRSAGRPCVLTIVCISAGNVLSAFLYFSANVEHVYCTEMLQTWDGKPVFFAFWDWALLIELSCLCKVQFPLLGVLLPCTLTECCEQRDRRNAFLLFDEGEQRGTGFFILSLNEIHWFCFLFFWCYSPC